SQVVVPVAAAVGAVGYGEGGELGSGDVVGEAPQVVDDAGVDLGGEAVGPGREGHRGPVAAHEGALGVVPDPDAVLVLGEEGPLPGGGVDQVGAGIGEAVVGR